MSKFSTLLDELIQAKNINVNNLSAYCRVDRSTMYKLISGKRNPGSLEIVHRIAEYLHLSPSEVREMTEAYEITRLGDETYYSRKDVLEFILNVQEIQSSSGTAFPAKYNFFYSETTEPVVPLSGRISILAALQNMILKESSFAGGELCILAQPEHLETLGLIPLLSVSHSRLSVKHVICINNVRFPNRYHHNYNLQCLKKILPFYGTHCSYQPVYYYDSIASHFNSFNFMPCVCLTSQAAVIFDSKINTGFFFQSQDLLQPFRSQFREIWNSSAPLMKSLELSPDLPLPRVPAAAALEPGTYILGFGPCISSCLPDDIFDKYLNKLLTDPSLLKEHLAALSRNRGHCYFSRRSLLHFLKTGLLYETPQKLYYPLEADDRIRLLKKFRLSSSCKDIRMFSGVFENFPPNFHLVISPGTGYLMFVNRKRQYFYLILEEQNLLRAFYDFVSSLEESELIFSSEETNKFLYEIIKNKGGIF